MRAYRLERVASTIRDVVSEAIQRRLNDPRIAPITSVTRVEVSGDLMYARVHVSVMGTPGNQRRTLGGLERSTRYIQSLLAKRLTTRHCPRLRFVLDPSIQQAMETNRIIDETMAEYHGAEDADDGTTEVDPSAQPGEQE